MLFILTANSSIASFVGNATCSPHSGLLAIALQASVWYALSALWHATEQYLTKLHPLHIFVLLFISSHMFLTSDLDILGILVCFMSSPRGSWRRIVPNLRVVTVQASPDFVRNVHAMKSYVFPPPALDSLDGCSLPPLLRTSSALFSCSSPLSIALPTAFSLPACMLCRELRLSASVFSTALCRLPPYTLALPVSPLS